MNSIRNQEGNPRLTVQAFGLGQMIRRDINIGQTNR